ncbi:MAG: OpgC domain-containing protein [Thermodesulfobacteriota bacterium]
MPGGTSSSKPRDYRLDFFRGLALLLIFIAHVPDNWLARYRPGAFGFSDSADIFVFISGYAVMMAYGQSFYRAGFIAGTARIMKRCAQLYACHIGLFFILAMICAAGNRYLNTSIDYIHLLNLEYFFEDTREAMLGLFTLRYVPNYFDILTLYIVLLAMVPPLMLIMRLKAELAMLACLALYLAVRVFGLELPAEIAYDRPWFFNPFAWQLLFFTGFFMSAGRLKPPPLRAGLTIFCAVYLIISLPLSHFPTYSHVTWLNGFRSQLDPLVIKTDLGILRWLHFLCLAYVAVALLQGREHVLQNRLAFHIVKTGQQSLSVFVTGMALSFLAGMVLDITGRGILCTVAVNAAGIILLISFAYIMAWFKSEPWRARSRSEAPAGGSGQAVVFEAAGPGDGIKTV